MNTLLRLPLALMIALGVVTGAHAQSKPRAVDSTVLPVWNRGSGKVEALLYLEPTGTQNVGARWNFGRSSLDAAFGLSSGDSLGLLCNGSGGSSIGGLASHCMLASLGDDDDNNGRHISATTAFNRPGGRVGITAGTGRDTLPAWLSNGGKAGAARVEQNDLTVFGQKNIGREGFVSIGGTYAKARLVPLTDAAPAVADQWDSKSLSVGGGYGAFSANVIGRVVDAPGHSGKWEGLGLGITWRTPWSGQLTVGAENVITRGKNPFSPRNESNDDGAIPYVRYEQDL